MSTEGLAKGLMQVAIVGMALRPYFWVKEIISDLSGGPIGFLSREEVREISLHPIVERIERGSFDNVIIVSKLKYGFLTPIKIEVSYTHFDSGRKFSIHEHWGHPNCLEVLRKNKLNYNFEKIQELLESRKLGWMANSIGTELNENYSPKMIADMAAHIATCCFDISKVE